MKQIIFPITLLVMLLKHIFAEVDNCKDSSGNTIDILKNDLSDSCCYQKGVTQMGQGNQFISKDQNGNCSVLEQPVDGLLKCAPGYCKKIIDKESPKCVELNDSIYTGFFKNSVCIDEDTLFSDGSCYGGFICREQVGTQYKCKKLKEKSPYIAKLEQEGICSDGKPHPDPTQKISLCVYGEVCLQQDGRQCLEFQNKRDPNFGGRGKDGKCLNSIDAQANAAICGKDYCLTSSYACTPLSTTRYIGREQTTSICIEIGQTNKIADSCVKGQKINKKNIIFCK